MTEHDVLDFPGADGVRAAGEVAPPSARAVEAVLTAVRAAVAAEAAEVGSLMEAVPLRAAVRRRRLQRLLVSAAAVAVIATGIAVYPVVGHGPGATATAADFLREVAATANERSLPQAPYWKVRSRTEPSSQIRTSWIGRNRSVGQHSEGGPVVESPPPEVYSWRIGDTGQKDITWDELHSLPTDAQELRARLTDDGAVAPDLLFNQAVNLLCSAPLEPAVRGALFEVLADTPGITLVGPVKDAAGRTGTAVEMRSDDRSWRMVLDPATGMLLEYGIYEPAGAEGDRLVQSDTYLSAEPAWSIPPTVSWRTQLTNPVLSPPLP